MKRNSNNGITLIALVVTIIVLLILAGVTIATLAGENGILTRANAAKLATNLSQYKEELDLYKISKIAEDANFSETSLTAGKNNLIYNIQKAGETGNIQTVINSLDDKYIDMVEIIKGEFLINTQDTNLIKVAQSLGIQVNPYDIVDGVLLSSNGNLLLMDQNGTITIPASVTEIGEGAFANLTGLKTIIIPGTVKKIGTNAFANNITLEKVIIQDGVEVIGDRAFKGCTNLKEVEMPESITNIMSQAFYNCKSLTTVEIPSKIKKINDYVFSLCSNLERIVFRGDKVTSIGVEGFYGNKISEFEITSNVTSISPYAFTACNNLVNIKINNNNNFVYEEGMLMPSNKESIIFISKQYYSTATEFSIPDGMKKFEANISGLSSIKKINIPSSIEAIDPGCLPINVETIQIDSNNLTYKIDEKCIYTKDNKYLVFCYSKDKNIVLTNEVDTIKRYAFKGAINSTEITLPESTTTIEFLAFSGANKLAKLNLGKKVSSINRNFMNRKGNIDIVIDSANPNFTVENKIIYSKNKEKIISVIYNVQGKFVLDSRVKEIGDMALGYQDNMTELVLNEGLSIIREYAFTNDRGLTEIEIPSSVTTMDSSCFVECTNLSIVKINKAEGELSGAPWNAPKGMKVVVWNK